MSDSDGPKTLYHYTTAAGLIGIIKPSGHRYSIAPAGVLENPSPARRL